MNKAAYMLALIAAYQAANSAGFTHTANAIKTEIIRTHFDQ